MARSKGIVNDIEGGLSRPATTTDALRNGYRTTRRGKHSDADQSRQTRARRVGSKVKTIEEWSNEGNDGRHERPEDPTNTREPDLQQGALSQWTLEESQWTGDTAKRDLKGILSS